ncbi:MAG: HNH endonuclease [Blautia sp.]|uniref:HNH endonuclease n=1 Tax=Blautia sp. TaxID=1955243 RepID=UPI002A8168E2|nr:HNH endonuclease [Blautia sp.]MDY4114623.1 HNH endonuclease [Blautia sp.]
MMKIDRQKVYDKYNGHCAYCGKPITIKDMQVDHILPKRNGGKDHIDNLNPSCRLCNHYKRAADIETLRNWLLGGLIERLMKIYIFRVALDYGMITINGWDKKFYYEKNGTDQER